jgi:hypothetical protein
MPLIRVLLLTCACPRQSSTQTFSPQRLGVSPLPTTPPQEHRQTWLHGPLSALDPEAVEKDLAVTGKALNKLGKVGVCGWEATYCAAKSVLLPCGQQPGRSIVCATWLV